MGNCFKKPSMEERLIQLDKSVGYPHEEDSVYATIYDTVRPGKPEDHPV